jgi:hypothetical protein
LRRRARACVYLCLSALAVAAAPHRAAALDKQTAAHQGSGGADTGQSLSGMLFFGALPFNPSYAARPDNSGLAVLRAGGHLDANLIGSRLFVPLDLNVFTDRCANPLRPSEVDVIGGLATAWPLLRGQIELGARAELDAAVDGSARLQSCNVGSGVGSKQGYGDVRARYAFALGEWWPALRPALADGDVTGWLTFGWFAVNPRAVAGSTGEMTAAYYARPENSGAALFRYVAHLAVHVWRRRLALVVDTNFFTDRDTSALRPSELDLTIEVVGTLGPWEAHVGYERDMPLDHGGFDTGLVQQMLMVTAGWSFDLPLGHPPRP